MYVLYFNKSERKIKLSKANKSMRNLNYTDQVVKYNDCHYICTERRLLKEKAIEIQQSWISEFEEALNSIKELKI